MRPAQKHFSFERNIKFLRSVSLNPFKLTDLTDFQDSIYYLFVGQGPKLKELFFFTLSLKELDNKAAGTVQTRNRVPGN